MIRAISLVTAMIFASLAGCHLLHRPTEIVREYPSGQPVDYYVSPWFYRSPPGRVVLLVPKCHENGYEIQTRFASAIGDELSGLGIFDILMPVGPCPVDSGTIRDGSFDARQLLDIAGQHNADGVLLCAVDSFSAYEPIHIACSLTLVDTRESIVTLHTSGIWDTVDDNVLAGFKQHVCRVHKCKQYAAGAYLKSPTEFFDYVAADLAGFIRQITLQVLTDG